MFIDMIIVVSCIGFVIIFIGIWKEIDLEMGE